MTNIPKPIKIYGPIFDYMSFLVYMHDLAEKHQTSGNLTSAARVDFTKLNYSRIKRMDQHLDISDALITETMSINRIQKWYVITESWCGDSAQVLPVIGKLSLYNNAMIELHILLRDENPEWMNFYHTKGALSIPKLIIRDYKGNDLATWGPRPLPAQEILLNWKAKPEEMNHEEFEIKLHTWYARDKTITAQQELLNTIISIKSLDNERQNEREIENKKTFIV
ncbi:MAG: thioredoxin family protein [Bacteroidetes bacterium]|nr:thioredoxin family protein [Bacteroidota bacterium]